MVIKKRKKGIAGIEKVYGIGGLRNNFKEIKEDDTDKELYPLLEALISFFFVKLQSLGITKEVTRRKNNSAFQDEKGCFKLHELRMGKKKNHIYVKERLVDLNTDISSDHILACIKEVIFSGPKNQTDKLFSCFEKFIANQKFGTLKKYAGKWVKERSKFLGREMKSFYGL